MQDFGEEGVVPHECLTKERSARFARENFCSARSNFCIAYMYWKLRQSTPINSALFSSSTITITKTVSN